MISGSNCAADSLKDFAVIVIGRNEGERLALCLRSLAGAGQIVYVDSGSTDGSLRIASAAGAELVHLDSPPPYTAARARNAGLKRLLEVTPGLTLVQVVDGDCEVVPGWLETAAAALKSDDNIAAVFGRRRERFPGASIYNRLCDDEWNVPVGEANSCGGDAMFRVRPLLEQGGYAAELIAGEEPDLCLRLRRNGWKIVRLDAEMTIHDAAIKRMTQWWKRARRGGHAFAELAHRHGTAADPEWRRQIASIILWGTLGIIGLGFVPMGVLSGRNELIIAASLVALLFIAQIGRLMIKRHVKGESLPFAASWAALTMLSKFAQLQGLLQFHEKRLSGGRSELIEYKS